jgi:hypothetical protein
VKFRITYQRDIIDELEAASLDEAARAACAAVFHVRAQDPSSNPRVHAIVRIDPPADTVPCLDCIEAAQKRAAPIVSLRDEPPTTPDVA